LGRNVESQRRLALVIGALAAAAALTGCGGGGDDPPAEQTPPTGTSDVESTPGPVEAPPEGTVELYFTSGEQFAKAERPGLADSQAALELAAEALVDGPKPGDEQPDAEIGTEIPAGTEVEDVSVADGTATVELSSRFLAGVPEAAARRSRAQQQEVDARVAQLTYTLTQFPQVDEARVVSGGVGVEPAAGREAFAKPAGGAPETKHRRGGRTASTRSIQERLAELRYLPKRAVDGVAGYRTQQAVIAFQSWEGLERDGIVGPVTSAALAESKPPQPRASGDERRIEVYRRRGVALVVVNGRTRRAIHVSTGAPGTTTPRGSFSVFRKEEMSWSVPFQQWLPWASYFFQGIAFHEYESVPAYRASHGCVRVPEPEARWLYRFADIGTKVVVF
jgi:lipoprotein-anchoring transpeptidase ErfK/SrfK